MTRPQTEVAGASTPVALIFFCGLLGGVAVNVFVPVPVWPSIWIRVLGLAPLAIGIGLFAWAREAFKRHQTPLMPRSPSSVLVQDGPFAISRNPIYLAFCIMYLGLALVFNSAYVLVMLVVAVALFDRIQVPREERYLLAKFGEDFTAYKAKVRRWL